MNDFTLIGELPRHHYVLVDSAFTHREPCGFVPAVWYGLVSQRNRAWGLTVMLESGAVYRNLPPHAIAFGLHAAGCENSFFENWPIHRAQRWNCYGERFSVIEYGYLAGLHCLARVGDQHFAPGAYLFTVAPLMDGFSQYPEQAKEFSFIKLDNGRLTIQPTNHLLFSEKSFTKNETMEFPRDLKRQFDIWSCEK